MKGFTKREAIENKIVASALVSYVKDKSRRGRDEINTNKDALGITDNEDYAWFTLQRALSGGAMPAMFSSLFGSGGNIDGGIHRNEARMVYNNLYNLLPSFRGYIKIYLSVFFILASAALSLGFTKPMFAWSISLLMDSAYLPVSALNYHVHSFIMSAGEVGQKFADLSSDPMLLLAAASIDSSLVFFQTTYFLVQFVIAALLVVGIIFSGFAVNKMSFGQGLAFGGALNSLGAGRFLGRAR